MRIKLGVYLIFMGVVVLTLSLIVIIRNRAIDTELLATIGLIGGLAIIVTAILQVISNGNGNGRSIGNRREL